MEAVFNLATQPIFLILAVVFGLAFLLHFLTSRKASSRRHASGSSDPLLAACLGDRSKADRLMMYEIRRQPGISKVEARSRAVERLSRDRSGYR